jgi:hypothetical protein
VVWHPGTQVSFEQIVPVPSPFGLHPLSLMHCSGDPASAFPPIVMMVPPPGNVGPLGKVEPGKIEPGALEPGEVDPGVVEPGSVEPGDVEPGDVEPGDVEPGELEPGAAAPPSPLAPGAPQKQEDPIFAPDGAADTTTFFFSGAENPVWP